MPPVASPATTGNVKGQIPQHYQGASFHSHNPRSRGATLGKQRNEIGKLRSPSSLSPISTVLEIESAVKELPIHEAQKLAQWLQDYVSRQTAADETQPASEKCRLPDYAARRRRIVGDKVLPNMVTLGREQERW